MNVYIIPGTSYSCRNQVICPYDIKRVNFGEKEETYESINHMYNENAWSRALSCKITTDSNTR